MKKNETDEKIKEAEANYKQKLEEAKVKYGKELEESKKIRRK